VSIKSASGQPQAYATSCTSMVELGCWVIIRLWSTLWKRSVRNLYY